MTRANAEKSLAGERTRKRLERVAVQSTGPGSHLVTLGVEGLELSIRLDRDGARVHSVGV